VGIELESLAEAMSQLAKIGQELMRPEDDRDPMWRSIPVAKEIMVSKGIATRAPWENIEVLNLLMIFLNKDFKLKLKLISNGEKVLVSCILKIIEKIYLIFILIIDISLNFLNLYNLWSNNFGLAT
jgi:hypothetical protein